MRQPPRRSVLAPISPNRVFRQDPPSQLPKPNSTFKPIQMAYHDDQDNTQSSFSTSSSGAISNTSLLDTKDLPDDLQRALQHDRDRKRMRNAVDGGAVYVSAFRKGRVPRVADTLTRLNTETRGDLDPTQAISAHQIASASYNIGPTNLSDSEHSTTPNIPKQWARKGRQRNDFLRRMNSDAPLDERPISPGDPDVIYPRRTAFTGDSPRSDVDWTATAAEIPLPSTDPDSPMRQRGSPVSGSFRRRAQRHSSLDRITEFDQGQTLHAGGLLGQGTRATSAEQTWTSAKGTGIDQAQPSTVALKGSETAHELPESNVNAIGDTLRQRHGTTRQGSRDLLKRLARASSTTPSPPDRPDALPGGHLPREEPATLSAQIRSSMGGNHRLPTPPEDDLEIFGENKGRIKSSRVPATRTNAPASQLMKQSRNGVEGITEIEPPEPQRTTCTEPASRRSSAPRSALEAVLQSNSSTSFDPKLGESTIASLRDILDDANDNDPSSTVLLDEETLELVNNVSVRIDEGKDVQQEERDQLARMNHYLRAARHGVRDASRGLKRVEDRVSDAEIDAGARNTTTGTDQSHCDRCGCPGGEGVTLSDILSRAFTSLQTHFVSRPKKGHARLTWAGLFCVLLLIWSMTEITLCEYYCHPLYASSMRGYGVNVHAPRIPFVTTTVLVERPFGWAIRPLWRPLYWILRPVITTLLGSTDATSIFTSDFGSERYASAFGTADLDDEVGFGQDIVL